VALWVVLLAIAVGVLAGCVSETRYSDDPATARIQYLTDFCIGYGALRDGATVFITVDEQRNTPVLTKDVVLAYRTAREFIKPYCSPKFDPQAEAFNLETLNEQLMAIRLLMLKRENAL
jgi:hypothetical protein